VRGEKMIDAKFYRNKETGAVVYGVAGNVEAADLELLQAGVTDGAAEKHVPFVAREGNTVTVRVGEVAHPMLEEHYIEFIALVSENGAQFAQLKPGQEPVATFTLEEGVEAEAYEYCNLHGLWKVSL